jgi:hypothetical protein
VSTDDGGLEAVGCREGLESREDDDAIAREGVIRDVDENGMAWTGASTWANTRQQPRATPATVLTIRA